MTNYNALRDLVRLCNEPIENYLAIRMLTYYLQERLCKAYHNQEAPTITPNNTRRFLEIIADPCELDDNTAVINLIKAAIKLGAI